MAVTFHEGNALSLGIETVASQMAVCVHLQGT